MSSTMYHLRTNRVNHSQEKKPIVNDDAEQERFKLGTWNGHDDKNIERVWYWNGAWKQSKLYDIEYEGWRRNNHYGEGPKSDVFVFNIRCSRDALKAFEAIFKSNECTQIGGSLSWSSSQSKHDNSKWPGEFKVVLKDQPDNSHYLDTFFKLFEKVEPLPKEIIQDLKDVITANSVYWFKRAFPATEWLRAKGLLRPNCLNGVPSPYYLAAQYCHSINFPKSFPTAAQMLLGMIPKTHWQYEIAQKFKAEITKGLSEHEERAVKLQTEKEAADKTASLTAASPPTSTTITSAATPVSSMVVSAVVTPIIAVQPPLLHQYTPTMSPENSTVTVKDESTADVSTVTKRRNVPQSSQPPAK